MPCAVEGCDEVDVDGLLKLVEGLFFEGWDSDTHASIVEE